MNHGIFSVLGSELKTDLPPVELTTAIILAGTFGSISYLLCLYLYCGMSIVSTVGISSIIIYII